MKFLEMVRRIDAPVYEVVESRNKKTEMVCR